MIDSDYSHLEGTNCYCSPESADEIRKAISSLPLEAVHFIGTGDYHYISLFWAERINEPFHLILLDNHPDDQPTAFSSDLLSCGDWVEQVRVLPNALATHWIRNSGDFKPDILTQDAAVYLSIDLDVLDRQYAVTDWDQGSMTPDEMESIILAIKDRCRIIGADICGGITESKGANENDGAKNAVIINRIASLLEQ